MPKTKVVYYAENGQCPFLEWMTELRKRELAAYSTGLARLKTLGEFGHELRRPVADLLRDGIYELRWRHGHVQYRILYFFHGRQAAVVSHGIVKEAAVDPKEIERAIKRKQNFELNPARHTVEKELENA